MIRDSTSIRPHSKTSFVGYVFQKKDNRRLLTIAICAGILQFIVFKSLYPYADFFSDSYSYIYAASANLNINIWPIGYSKFLMLIHGISHSDLAVVGFQYFLLQFSALYFFFSLLYLYNLSKSSKYILFVFLFLNPLFLYISNYINSDPLFAALSLLWFTELFWIIHRPRHYQVFLHAALIFLCFAIRNNAYYYPVVAVLTFLISRHNIRNKLVGIILPLTLISIFIVNTRSIAKQMTGKSQFSLFTGWQLANNALYMYGKVKVDSMQFTSIETREINRISYTFYKYAPSDFHDYLSEYVANFFIRQPQSPLKVYYSRHYRSRNELEAIKNWGKASLSYADFGKRLILSHPWAYMRYFVLLNTKNYFVPPLEKLEIYNLGDDEVGITAQDWFDYKTAEVTSISKTAQGNVLALFPYIFLFLNIFFIGSIAWMVINQNYKAVDKNLVRTFLITICLCLANFLFCITATIIVLRYEFFPMIILLALPLVLIDSIDSFVVVNKMQNTSSETKSNNLQVIQAPFINK